MQHKEYKISKPDTVLFLIGFLGFLTTIFLYPRLSPETAIRTERSQQEIVKQSVRLINNIGYSLDYHNQNLSFDYKRSQLRYLNQAFGPLKTNRLIQDSIAVFYHSLYWSSKKMIDIQFGDENEKEQFGLYAGDIWLLLDLKGRPIYFEFQPEETEEPNQALSSPVNEETSRKIAEKWAQKLTRDYGGAWYFDKQPINHDQTGNLYLYQWTREGKIANETIRLDIQVQNGRIQKFEKQVIIPESFTMKEHSNTAEDISIVVLFLSVFILGIIYFIQRLRLDLMDLKSGLIPGVIVLIGWSCIYGLRAVITSNETIGEVLLGFLLTAPFIAGGMWALYSVGESLTREVWPKKLITLDSLRKKILSPYLGLGIFRGMALIGLCMGIMNLLNYASIILLKGYYNLGESPLYFWSSSWPSLTAIGKGFLSAFYIVVTFCLFLMTLLKRKFKSNVFIIVIAVFIWSLARFPVPQLLPFALRSGINSIIGLIIVLFLFRYDFFTVAFGTVAFPILHYGIVSLYSGNAFFTLHGAILLGMITVPFLIAFLAYRSEPASKEAIRYVPDYIQRIYEREKLQKELEIARNVQLRFLPRVNPKIQGMDIASLCIPAEEVGGDYYDFIQLGDRKLGILIGDVSGKGISAAIYMTLTKGLFQARARDLFSPKEVLIHINESFYENAERGIFISMIYAIFDLTKMQCTYARAGHNPMIFWRSEKKEAAELCPSGIAIGLESGKIFDDTIREERVHLKKDDTLLLYTDGLNEAQNRFQEEFGEDKLRHILIQSGDRPSKEILEKIRDEISRFTLRARQHDDMTAVLIKIL